MEIDNSNKIDDFNVGDEVIISSKEAKVLELNGKTGEIIEIRDNKYYDYPIIVKIIETNSVETFKLDEIELLKPTKNKQYSIFN